LYNDVLISSDGITLLISRHFSAALNLTHYITQLKWHTHTKICCIIWIRWV